MSFVKNPQIIKMGLVSYRNAMEQMEKIHAEVCAGGCESALVVQHSPVVTVGNRFLPNDMLVQPTEISACGVDFVHTDRGGSATVHEPGQVVVYPIFRIQSRQISVRKFVWCLEEAMIRVASYYGVIAARDAINAGIWVGKNKLGAIGIRITERVSKHGLAFNVVNDLSTFRYIIPCGLRDRGVTTLAREIALIKQANIEETVATLDPDFIGEQIAQQIVSFLVEKG